MDRADSTPASSSDIRTSSPAHAAPHLAPSPHVHRPKVETFDTQALTNVDPKGFVRSVDTYTEKPWGLYMARPADHPNFSYLESWLLPDLGLRVSKFHFTPAGMREQDHYVDIVEVDRDEHLWRTTDLYLDIIVLTGRDTHVLDADELSLAIAEGVIAPARGEYAIDRALSASIGIAHAGHDVDRWLADQQMPVDWLGYTPTARSR